MVFSVYKKIDDRIYYLRDGQESINDNDLKQSSKIKKTQRKKSAVPA